MNTTSKITPTSLNLAELDATLAQATFRAKQVRELGAAELNAIAGGLSDALEGDRRVGRIAVEENQF
ncbi:hypothetical protein [Parachitinimonas caeni]|uniref:Uncharacterized protein n=1 Tax=Parachitinimonas caeni TaxID=3031301 RepID=A0ABT7DVW1_9NEIS|nr:hypothetical protein [Parachitinimonas caeni]MDK2123984.1 hypothetical protein [Parachitinimonas caeni]